MSEEPRLDVLNAKRLAEQRVVEQVDLADGQVVRGTPVGIHLAEERVHGGVILGSGTIHRVFVRGRPVAFPTRFWDARPLLFEWAQ